MISQKHYILTMDGYIQESFTSTALLWDYLTEQKLNDDFTFQKLEQHLDRSKRFEFEWNSSSCVIKLDYPNRGLSALEWLGIE